MTDLRGGGHDRLPYPRAARFVSRTASTTSRLLDALERVTRLNAARSANDAVARALERLGQWQARRLRHTYADLAADSRYCAAIRFFESELYGGGDFSQRDADLARVVPLMVRMLPETVIATIADAVELNALSHELDASLVGHLASTDGALTVPAYCNAYRAMGCRAERERQIALIADVGGALDGHVRRPLVRGALAMMRKPAHLAGFGMLHAFLQRGFDAFRAMRGARDFLDTVVAREMALMQRILAGETAPFPDPLSGFPDARAG